MEAFISAGEERVPEPDTGSVIGDLQAILIPVFRQNAAYRLGTAMANKGMMAEAQLSPEFHQTYVDLHRSWWGPLRNVLERGISRGEMDANLDVQVMIDMMLGASWYRVLLEHEPLSDDFARSIIRTVVDGNRTHPD